LCTFASMQGAHEHGLPRGSGFYYWISSHCTGTWSVNSITVRYHHAQK
jgi:hypothetical protein